MAVKKLSELTVAELKHELKKRKLDFTGEKAVLLARLRKSLVEDANRAKLAQQQKVVKEGEEDKKSAEEMAADQKKEENIAGQASICEEKAKACTAHAESKDDNKDHDVDKSTHSDKTLSVVDTSSMQVVANTSVSDPGSKARLIPNEKPEEVTQTERISSAENVQSDVSEPAGKVEASFEAPVPESGTRDGVGEVGNEEGKMDAKEEMRRVEEIAETETNRMENTKVEQEPGLDCIAQSLPEAPKNEEAIDDAKMEVDSDANVALGTKVSGSADVSLAREEDERDQCPETVRRTEAAKPTSESVHAASAAVPAAPKINETATAAMRPDPQVNTLWVSGMVKVVKASDLKQAFNQYGRVVSAKIVTSAKYPGSRCFGLVTMFSHEDALKCIDGFNGKMLLGSLVTVELDTKQRVTRPQANRQVQPGTASTNVPQAEVVTGSVVKAEQTPVRSQPEPTKPAVDTPKSSEVKKPLEAQLAVVKPEVSKVVPIAAVPKVAASVAPSKPVEASNSEKAEVSTSVWLSGFPNTIKAAELKAFCLAAGKVMAAKVVANAKLQTYYGLVTMATVEDARNCLKKLNGCTYEGMYKITCEMSPSNSVTTELLKHFSRNKPEQAPNQPKAPATTVAVVTAPPTPKPQMPASGSSAPAASPSVKPAVVAASNSLRQGPSAVATSEKQTPPVKVSQVPKKPDLKNGIKKGKNIQKKAPLIKTPPGGNRNFRRSSPRGRNNVNRYAGNTNNRSFSGILDDGMMGRAPFGGAGRSMMDDRNRLVYLEEERRLTQEMAMLNAQREKLQIESLRLEREREKMEAERARQDQLALQRRNEWKPLVPMKRPHEQEEVCWRPPPQSAAKRFASSSDYDSFPQLGLGRRPPLLDDRDVRHLDRGMGGSSLLGPRGSFSVGQGRFQDYY